LISALLGISLKVLLKWTAKSGTCNGLESLDVGIRSFFLFVFLLLGITGLISSAREFTAEKINTGKDIEIDGMQGRDFHPPG